MFSQILNSLTSSLPVILVTLLLITGVISLLDFFVWRKERSNLKVKKLPFIIEHSRSFFPVFLIVLVLRSFVFQPFNVPTGSLEPTVMPGDYLFVTQYSYGLRTPVWHQLLMPVSSPKRGDIIVLRSPVHPDILLVKRLIGLPGDDISYIDKVLYINGKKMQQTFVKNSFDVEPGDNIAVKEMSENLSGKVHNILINPNRRAQSFYHLHVPKGQYFMMGDNRDNSDDSRSWGFVPAKNLEGKAKIIFFNWNSKSHHPEWKRIGIKV
jgi:signal peptidase I